MPLPCNNPRYRMKDRVRLAFCGKKVVEVKKRDDDTPASYGTLSKLLK